MLQAISLQNFIKIGLTVYVTEGEILMTKYFFSIQTFPPPYNFIGVKFSAFEVAYVRPQDASYVSTKFHQD